MVSLPVNVGSSKLSLLKLPNCAFVPRISRGSRLFTDLYFSVRSSRSSALIALRAAILHECQNYLEL